MKLKVILIAGGLASLAVVGAYAVSPDVRQGVKAGEAAITLVGHRHGWGHRGHRGGMAHKLCSDARTDHIEAAITFAETFMAFTPEQRAAWDKLTGAVRAGGERIGETCAETEALRAEKTMPAKLALAEAATKTAAAVLGDVRPAFNAWYGTLSDEQRKALDDLLSRRHGGRKG